MSQVIISSVNVHGSYMRYCRFGEGDRILVIIPGLSIKSVAEQGDIIASAFAGFTENYTVYLFDRISDVPEVYDVEDMAGDTVEAMTLLGIKRACFYGASQGGMIVQVIAEEWPEMVEKAVIASSASCCNETLQRTVEHWISLAERHDRLELAQDFAEMIYGQATLEKFRDSLIQSNIDVTDEELDRFCVMAKACLNYYRYDEMVRISANVLIVGCDGDRVLSGEASKEMAVKLGDRANLLMYGSEYGHGVYDEASDFLQNMLEFLG